MEDRHLSLSAVAGRLGVSERSVRRWIKAGKLKALRPGRDYRIPESAFREFVKDSEVDPKAASRSPSEPSLNDALEDERREAIYQPWLDFVNCYADDWEQRLAAGAFNLSSLNEFDRVTDYLLDTLSPLGLQEKREQPEGYEYTYGPIIGEAIGRVFDLLYPMLAAAAEKYPEEVLGDDLEPLRRKRDEGDEKLRELRRGA